MKARVILSAKREESLGQKGRFDMSKIQDINEHKEKTAPLMGTSPELDSVLTEALRPAFSPSPELNRQLLSGEVKIDASRQKAAAKRLYVLPKVAAVVLAVLCVGGAGVYAATQLLKEPVVTEHAISVGNTEYIDDAAIADTEEPVTTNRISYEEGTADTLWTSKKVSEVNGYVTTTYTFDSYAKAQQYSGIGTKFTTEYLPESKNGIIYSVTENEGFRESELSADLKYREGSFTVLQSRSEVGFAEDFAFSVKLQNTSNERDYRTKDGVTYHLVDETISGEDGNKVNTYVMIATDDYEGFISFRGLSEEEIHEVLDTVVIE